MYGGVRNTKIYSEKLKKSFGRHKRRREDNIKVDLKEIGEAVGWSQVAYCRYQWRFLEQGNLLSDSIKGGKFLDQLNDYQFL
jgi:hypothetical protein